MAYAKTNRLVMKRVPSGVQGFGSDRQSMFSATPGVAFAGDNPMGNILDTIIAGARGGVKLYDANRAGSAVTDVNAALVAQDEGVSTTTLAIGGLALAGVLYFVLRKKK